eukprot:scaffold104019_cov21-Tisochrysis_lutea.AAC.1
MESMIQCAQNSVRAVGQKWLACNLNVDQRKDFVNLAVQLRASIHAVVLDLPFEVGVYLRAHMFMCTHFWSDARVLLSMLEPGHGAHVSHANMPAPFLRACADVLEPSNGQGPPSQHASIPNHTCHAVFYLCLSCVHAQTCLSRAMARTNHPTGKTGKEVVPIVYSMRREMMNGACGICLGPLLDSCHCWSLNGTGVASLGAGVEHWVCLQKRTVKHKKEGEKKEACVGTCNVRTGQCEILTFVH